jgi:hypothetical protein
MDPITLIVTALATGASAALKDTATDAIKSAYGKLKSLVLGKLGRTPTGEMVLNQHEADPDTWKEPLKKELGQAGADQDEEIKKAALAVTDLVAPHVSRMYTQQIFTYGPVTNQSIIQHAEHVGFPPKDPD